MVKDTVRPGQGLLISTRCQAMHHMRQRCISPGLGPSQGCWWRLRIPVRESGRSWSPRKGAFDSTADALHPISWEWRPSVGGVAGGETPTRPFCSPCSLFGSPQEERVQDADSVRRQQQAHQQHSCTLDECFQFYTKEEQVPPWGSAPLLDGEAPGPVSGWAHGPGGFPSSWPRTTRGVAPTARPCSRGW